MKPSNSIFLCLLLLTTSGIYAHAATVSSYHESSGGLWRRRPAAAKMLFVFGDSYADTGNVRKSMGNSWKEPYGSTFPGKPAGRFSDGRVLTDYLARFLGHKSPVAYTWMKLAGVKKLRNGMNFAYGGSGVFDTYTALPNMSSQIGFFEKLVEESVYTRWDLQSSVVLVCLSGNDYAAYLARGGAAENVQSFIPRVVNQLVLNLRRIKGLGATRIAVTALQPLGCLPRMTQASSFRQCNMTQNMAVGYHNLLLQQAIATLNNEYSSNNVSFLILDLYSSFSTVLEQRRNYQGNARFGSPLKPCCMGTSNTYSCGSMDSRGQKMYTVCSDPKSAFFWDASHPTEAGWREVFTNLRSTLDQLYKARPLP